MCVSAVEIQLIIVVVPGFSDVSSQHFSKRTKLSLFCEVHPEVDFEAFYGSCISWNKLNEQTVKAKTVLSICHYVCYYVCCCEIP